ncbi:hypothetical protein ABH922_003057 [Rhodococcus sp. 27YEA15]|uniref:hypothetical protein n=1 Tax=Rhodococcus sp. 27YEA15 TaxID=3156259 RepID=UPI003C7BAB3E
MSDDTQQPTPIITSVAANRARTVVVRATEQSVPVDLRIDQDELRYGGARLAAQILTLCERAGLEAGARHRVELEDSGVPASVLDRLGLATAEQVARAQAVHDRYPATWMREL